MPNSHEVLRPYEEARSIAEAAAALDALEPGPDLPSQLLADCCDDLSDEAVELEEYAMAVRLQRRAIELGCTNLETARQMLPWHLLLDGQTEAGEAAFAELRAERPGDVELLVTVGNARLDTGDGDGAVVALDEALALAYEQQDQKLVEMVRIERCGARREHGVPEDEDDRHAMNSMRRVAAEAKTVPALPWFDAEQRVAAVARWPQRAEQLEDPDYDHRLEEQLRDLHSERGRRPAIAAIDVDALVAWAQDEEDDCDPSLPGHWFAYASELADQGDTRPWPPGRNEPCWCGSHRKYKRCCGSL